MPSRTCRTTFPKEVAWLAELTSIAEVTEIMAALDEDDAAFLEAEGCAPEAILGDGDLLDDFVESAQQQEQTDAAGTWDGVLDDVREADDGSDASGGSQDGDGPPELVRRCSHHESCHCRCIVILVTVNLSA